MNNQTEISQSNSRLSNWVLPSGDIIIILLNFPRIIFWNVLSQNVSSSSFRKIPAYLAHRVLLFLNETLSTSCLANSMKDYNTILKNNKLNYLHLNSYHPISKLTLLSKLIESIIIPQLINYITTNSILHLNQSSLIHSVSSVYWSSSTLTFEIYMFILT